MFDLRKEPDELHDVFIQREVWTSKGPEIQTGYGTIGDADMMDPGWESLEEWQRAFAAGFPSRVVNLEPQSEEPFPF